MKQLLALFLTVTSLAATAGDNWINNAGDPWRNASGQCWRNSSWTPATAHPNCDGALKPVAPVAVPAAPAPIAPAPVVVQPKAEQPKPLVIKVSYATDALFDFDKSVIKPEGKANLNDLLDKLKAVNLEVVIVVGHTDSVGTDAYNLKLGERRANAVKAYLVSNGIEKNRVYSESKGEKQPIADNKTAQGRAKNRRVEIEVVGTKK